MVLSSTMFLPLYNQEAIPCYHKLTFCVVSEKTGRQKEICYAYIVYTAVPRTKRHTTVKKKPVIICIVELYARKPQLVSQLSENSLTYK